MIQVVAVPLQYRSLVQRFIRVPWFIHREHAPNEHWVPPLMMDRRDYLDPAKNPFFEHAEVRLWIAVVDGVDVGRIAAVVDRDYIAFHGEQAGYFGMFECIDDREVAQALLARAREWLVEQGMERMIGPLDLSTNYMCGVLVDGFDRDPCVNMPYNPPYYPALVESCGMTKEKDLLQWRIDTRKELAPRIDRLARLIAKREGIKVRNYRFDDWEAEVARTLDIYNSAWEKNWGFVPMSAKEFHHIAKDLKMVLNPKITFMAEVDGEPVAFALSIKNINPTLKKIDGKLFPFGAARLAWDLMLHDKVGGSRLILLGVRKEYRRRGIDSILFAETFRGCASVGYFDGEIGWTLEDNDLVNRAIVSMNGFLSSTYRVYQQRFAGADEAST